MIAYSLADVCDKIESVERTLDDINESTKNIDYKLEFILGEDSDKTRGNIICKYNKKEIEIKNIFNNQFDKKIKVLNHSFHATNEEHLLL